MNVAPYVGGLHSVEGVADVIVLASNETPIGPSPNAIRAYQSASRALHRYPDGHATELRNTLGRRFGCDMDRIV